MTSLFWTPVGNIKKIRTSSPILRPARRVLNEPLAKNSDLHESKHELSSPNADPEIVCVKDHPLPNVSTGSHCWSGPSDSNHLYYTLDDLDMQLFTQFQDALQAEDRIPEKSTTSNVGQTSRCTSLNITEFARRHQDDTDDDLDEVNSSLDPAFVFVNGYRVKKEYGPLLSAIFEKYGDITKESEGKPPNIVSFFLERACAIFERLKGMKFSQATQKDLTEMLDEVCFLESQKLNLGWLHEKLVYIRETKKSFRDYLTVKEEGKRSDATIASLRNEMSSIEEKLVVELAKSDQIKKRASDIKAKVNDLWTHSLVHGLL